MPVNLPRRFGCTTVRNSLISVLSTSSTAGKRQNLISNVRFPLNADMVVRAATLLERTSCPNELVLDFLWLLSAKADMVDDPVGFVSGTF